MKELAEALILLYRNGLIGRRVLLDIMFRAIAKKYGLKYRSSFRNE